jgi:hypothetical protein
MQTDEVSVPSTAIRYHQKVTGIKPLVSFTFFLFQNNHKLTVMSPALLYSPSSLNATNSFTNVLVPITCPIASQFSHSTPRAQATGMNIFANKNSIPTSSNPTRYVNHLTVESAKLNKATKAMSVAIILRNKSSPFLAPFDAASRSDVSVLE